MTKSIERSPYLFHAGIACSLSFLALVTACDRPSPFKLKDMSPKSDRKASWDPPKSYPEWTYDEPTSMKPAADLQPEPKARESDPLHYFTNKKLIPIRQPAGYKPEEIPRICVWWSDSNGFEWQKAGYFGVNQSHFWFEAPADGDYGIRFVGPGQAPATIPIALPERVYHLDTVLPEVEIFVDPNQAWYNPGATVSLNWRAHDYHLIEQPVSIHMTLDFTAERPAWTLLQKDLAAEGSYSYTIPKEALDHGIVFRISALDRAGNLGMAMSHLIQVIDEPVEETANAADDGDTEPDAPAAQAAPGKSAHAKKRTKKTAKSSAAKVMEPEPADDAPGASAAPPANESFSDEALDAVISKPTGADKSEPGATDDATIDPTGDPADTPREDALPIEPVPDDVTPPADAPHPSAKADDSLPFPTLDNPSTSTAGKDSGGLLDFDVLFESATSEQAASPSDGPLATPPSASAQRPKSRPVHDAVAATPDEGTNRIPTRRPASKRVKTKPVQAAPVIGRATVGEDTPPAEEPKPDVIDPQPTDGAMTPTAGTAEAVKATKEGDANTEPENPPARPQKVRKPSMGRRKKAESPVTPPELRELLVAPLPGTLPGEVANGAGARPWMTLDRSLASRDPSVVWALPRPQFLDHGSALFELRYLSEKPEMVPAGPGGQTNKPVAGIGEFNEEGAGRDPRAKRP